MADWLILLIGLVAGSGLTTLVFVARAELGRETPAPARQRRKAFLER